MLGNSASNWCVLLNQAFAFTSNCYKYTHYATSVRVIVFLVQTADSTANTGVVYFSVRNPGYTFTPCVGTFTSRGIDTV